jgi:hypothetical protein
MAIRVIKSPVKRAELLEIAREEFGDVVKAVVDVEQGIMAIGGELHADEEVLLTEKEGSKREHTWGINLYPKKSGEEWIEFDSMMNIKPALGNRSRGVDDPATRARIKEIVRNLIID